MTTCIGENLVIKKLLLVLFAAVLTAFPAAAPGIAPDALNKLKQGMVL